MSGDDKKHPVLTAQVTVDLPLARASYFTVPQYACTELSALLFSVGNADDERDMMLKARTMRITVEFY